MYLLAPTSGVDSTPKVAEEEVEAEDVVKEPPGAVTGYHRQICRHIRESRFNKKMRFDGLSGRMGRKQLLRSSSGVHHESTSGRVTSSGKA